MAEENFVKWYSEVGIADVPSVGGKNAALGEMYSNLVPAWRKYTGRICSDGWTLIVIFLKKQV